MKAFQAAAFGLPSYDLQHLKLNLPCFPTVPIYTFIHPGDESPLSGKPLSLSIPLRAQSSAGTFGLIQQARVR